MEADMPFRISEALVSSYTVSTTMPNNDTFAFTEFTTEPTAPEEYQIVKLEETMLSGVLHSSGSEADADTGGFIADAFPIETYRPMESLYDL
jgi:hypothetical protein